MTTNITEIKPVWLVISNVDLTEGRGYQYTKYTCEKESTAIRLGKKGYIQGSDCPIKKDIAVKIENRWYINGKIEYPTQEDLKLEQEMLKERELLERVNEVINKAKQLGLTNEELHLLTSNIKMPM